MPALDPLRLSARRDRLAALLLPPCCVACGLPADDDGLCRPCLYTLAPPPSMPPPAFGEATLHVRAGWAYDAASAPLLTGYKFGADLAAGRALARHMAQRLANAPRPGALVPIPLHRDRLRERGHDQALGIATDWGRWLGVPVRADLLHRQRATAPQTSLDAEARRRNLAGAFRVQGRCPPSVALVDDVLTTGSTAAAAAEALRAAGGAHIEVWVLAQAARAK